MPASEFALRSYSALQTGVPLVEIQTSATDHPCITQIGFTASGAAGTTTVVGVGVPAAKGVIRTNATVPLLDLESDTSVVANLTIGVDWTTFPTAPTNYLRRKIMATSTTGIIPITFDFPEGLILLPSSSIVIFLITYNAGNSAQFYDYWVEFDG